jgi:surfactin synthase thioesterase subunit
VNASTRGAVKLACLHQAGGSPAPFVEWARQAPPDIEVIPVALPTVGDGLGARRRHTSTVDLVPDVAATVAEQVGDDPYVIFGHSMGGLLAYLIARRFFENGGPRPRALVVACYSAPEVVAPGLHHDDIGTAEIVHWLHYIGGIPDWLAAEPELLAPHLGLLRDDLRVCATYRHVAPAEPLDIPVHVFGATEDRLVHPDDVRRWQSVGRSVTTTFLPGGHHLVSDDGDLLRKCVFDLTTEVS